MVAPTLDLGTSAYYALTGPAPVPPRYAFGFIASRWGWQDRAYIESVRRYDLCVNPSYYTLYTPAVPYIHLCKPMYPCYTCIYTSKYT